MYEMNETRVGLRRETHELNDQLATLLDKLEGVDEDAALAVRRARAAMFEAWTILCAPPEEDEDH